MWRDFGLFRGDLRLVTTTLGYYLRADSSRAPIPTGFKLRASRVDCEMFLYFLVSFQLILNFEL